MGISCAASGWHAHPSDHALAEPALTAVHDALGGEEYEAARREGEGLGLEELAQPIAQGGYDEPAATTRRA